MRQHQDWISAYLQTIVPRSEAPERFHFWIAAAIIAGAVRRRIYIEMEAFRWYPNMFVVLVGPPGTVKKSTTINVGARLLRDVPNINFGADVATWEGFIQQVEEAKDIFAEGSVNPNARLSFDQEHKISSAITVIISEWGTFLDPNNHLMVNMLTELYDGKSDIPLHKTTKTQGDNIIINPFINMIAGTTPDWMADNFRGKFGGWGFSSRCIFLYCAAPERAIAYPDEEWRGTFKASMRPFLHDLVEISNLQGQMEISDDARAYGREWYTQHMDRKIQLDAHPDHDPWISYYLARKWDHAHKLAMCLSASRGSDLVISLSDIMAATSRCDEVELGLGSIFASTSQAQSRAGKLNTDVWKGLENIILKNGGGVPERAGAFRFTCKFMAYREAKDLIDGLVNSQVLAREVQENGEAWLVFGKEYLRQ